MTVEKAATTMAYFKVQIGFCASVINSAYEKSEAKARAVLKQKLYDRGYGILKRYLWGEYRP